MSDQYTLTHFEFPHEQAAPPVWPLPILAGNHPAIVGAGERWNSVRLGYHARNTSAPVVPVFAVGNGEISLATDRHVGIHHRNGFETHYAQVAHVLMKPCTARTRKKQWVRAGEVIGFIAAGDYVPFEIWQRGRGYAYRTVSVAPHMACWRHVRWTGNAMTVEQPRMAA
jgi:hypothetical protein